MEFIEAPAFTRYLSEYLTDDEYWRLQILLTVDPERGDLMPGTTVGRIPSVVKGEEAG